MRKNFFLISTKLFIVLMIPFKIVTSYWRRTQVHKKWMQIQELFKESQSQDQIEKPNKASCDQVLQFCKINSHFYIKLNVPMLYYIFLNDKIKT